MSYPIRKIGPEDHQRFLKAMSVPFGFDLTSEGANGFELPLQHADLCSAFDGDQIVSTFGSYHLDFTVPGGVSVPAAGTTVVTVLTTHRRQGILRAHMREHFREAHDNGEVFAVLWASESHIYGRFGYGPATESRHITFSKAFAKLREPVDLVGKMRLLDLEDALETLPAIYESVAQQRAGMFVRTPGWWKVRVLADLERHRRGGTAHRRVVFRDNGQDRGYVLYRTQTDASDYTATETVLSVVELIAHDREAELALWQYLFNVDLVDKIRCWNLPIDSPLNWHIEQPRELNPTPSDAVWLRPIDVREALNRRHYQHAGEVVFRFRDEVCSWNDGVFRLETNADGTGQCKPSTDDPTVELAPFTLGAAYLGGTRVHELAKAGLITGRPEAVAQLDAILAWNEPPWCQEVF